jgi:2-alkyl-3-oxoalkanoate reductase
LRALVTGGGGFLGSWIVRQLVERGDQVRIIARGAYPEIAALGVECLRGDVEDENAVLEGVDGVDVVFHVAGKPGIWGPKESYFRPNVLGTKNVIEACRKKRISRLVHTSSPSVVFGKDAISGGDEDLAYPDEYLCHYPESKAEAERLVMAAHEPNRLHTVALRPHLIWGPGDRFLIPKMIEAAKTGRIRRVGDETNLVSITYVENAASAHLAACEAIRSPDAPAGGKTYFVADPEPVEIWRFIDRVLVGVGAPPITGHISFRAAWIIGTILELVHHALGREGEPRMTRFLAAQLGKPHWFKLDRAKRELGWTPPHSTEEGLKRLFASFRSAPAL